MMWMFQLTRPYKFGFIAFKIFRVPYFSFITLYTQTHTQTQRQTHQFQWLGSQVKDQAKLNVLWKLLCLVHWIFPPEYLLTSVSLHIHGHVCFEAPYINREHIDLICNSLWGWVMIAKLVPDILSCPLQWPWQPRGVSPAPWALSRRPPSRQPGQ